MGFLHNVPALCVLLCLGFSISTPRVKAEASSAGGLSLPPIIEESDERGQLDAQDTMTASTTTPPTTTTRTTTSTSPPPTTTTATPTLPTAAAETTSTTTTTTEAAKNDDNQQPNHHHHHHHHHAHKFGVILDLFRK